MVRFNDKNGLVSFEAGRDNRSFTARSILGFEFFDEKVARQRIFYTVEYADKDEPLKRPLIFEVLMDLKDFAVLSKLDPVEVKQKVTSYNNVYNAITGVEELTTTVRLNETVYILLPSGDLKPYLKVSRKHIDRTFFNKLLDTDRTSTQVVDNNLLKDYFPEPGYSKMIKYAQDSHLFLDDKEDLIKVLEYYKSISNNK